MEYVKNGLSKSFQCSCTQSYSVRTALLTLFVFTICMDLWIGFVALMRCQCQPSSLKAVRRGRERKKKRPSGDDDKIRR